ncbi:hypothetical protein FHS74_000678 [Nitrospirillum iridis]|uniref:Uncharacterized protein n=1 Tax=Nitrospirillum iridis TaxID=765888 RepID=A0A7X0EB08_9PROT|nr:hypothetical protein [Nitrospirillum iridis]
MPPIGATNSWNWRGHAARDIKTVDQLSVLSYQNAASYRLK